MEPARSWTGRDATTLRKILRMTTEGFASELGVAARTVANWSSHPEMVPRAGVQEILDDLLARSTPNVRARFAESLDGTSPAQQGQALKVAIAVVAHSGRVLLVRRRDEGAGITWQFPAGIIKPGERGEDVATWETLAETGIHCSVTHRIGSRLHPVTGVLCDYYAAEYLAGEATNRDTVENAGVTWAPQYQLSRFVPREKIFPPVLVYLEEQRDAASSR